MSVVYDPIAAGRRSALRAVSVQAGIAALAAVVFLLWQGGPAALAAGIGAGAMALGNAAMAWLALPRIVDARTAFARLMLGVVTKWCVVAAILWIAIGVWQLPALPMLAGLVAGLLAYLLALNAQEKNRSRRLPGGGTERKG